MTTLDSVDVSAPIKVQVFASAFSKETLTL